MRIYGASRTIHADMWKALRADGVDLTSTWIDEAGVGETQSLSVLWENILCDVIACDLLVLYAPLGDYPLKGALVEVGMALALGKRVRIVIPGVTLERPSMRPVGSWMMHPLCSLALNIDNAVRHPL